MGRNTLHMRPAGVPRARRLRAYLWREWCFLRAALRQSWPNLALLAALLLVGAWLFQLLEPERGHSLPRAIHHTLMLILANPPEDYPRSPLLQVLFFVAPLLGLLVIVEGLVDFVLLLRDRKRNERSWYRTMASALSGHVIIVGLGKLGLRTFRLLQQLHQLVVVIERDKDNQFLDEVRRAGAPLFVGDARRERLLEEANCARARSVILATNDDLTNLEVALDARQINPRIHVVLRMFDQNMADKVRAGFQIQIAMSQSAISAPTFALAALEDGIESSMLVDGQALVAQRWRIDHGCPLVGQTIADVMRQFHVAVLSHQPPDSEARLLPGPDVRLEAGDAILVQGTLEGLAALKHGMVQA